MDKVNDFVVDTEGQCFFCLTQISNPFSPNQTSQHEPEKNSPSFNSLHCFSRYLGVDKTKVFNEKGNIPSRLLSIVQRSRLKVGLCDDCAVTIDKFSRLYEQLEKIEIEMSFHLKHIQVKLARVEDVKRENFISTDEFKGKHEILEVLRTESLQKCTSRLSLSAAPRVKVQNLSTAQLNIMKGKKHGHRIPFSSTVESSSNSNEQCRSDIKLEGCYMDDAQNEEEGNDNYPDYDNDEQFQKDIDDNHLGIRQQNISLSKEDKRHSLDMTESKVRKFSVSKITLNTKYQSIFDPNTGKHKCGICSREFSAKRTVWLHHKSVHLKVKYKCTFCNKEFSRKDVYETHYRKVHIGVRFKCWSCNKMFTLKSNLLRHHATVHKKRFP